MKPNIFFLILDGFRGDLCFGKNKTSITPNIDKLVKNGIYFKQAISSGMSSTPSVCSIFTSLYPFESLVQDGKLFKINPKITTYVEMLDILHMQLYKNHYHILVLKKFLVINWKHMIIQKKKFGQD